MNEDKISIVLGPEELIELTKRVGSVFLTKKPSFFLNRSYSIMARVISDHSKETTYSAIEMFYL